MKPQTLCSNLIYLQFYDFKTNERVKERFLGFLDVSHNSSAYCLAKHVFRLLHEYKCNDKLVAHAYDEAAVYQDNIIVY